MDLSDPKILRAFLERHGLVARKGLGQHFLCSSRVVRTIIERAAGFRGILEIGPGPGVLAGPLSESAERFIAIELDAPMVEALKESAPRAEVVQADALTADLAANLERLPKPRAVVSNLPYYITGPLVTRIAEARDHFDLAVLMMQKEVGIRVLAPPGNRDRGSLSVYLQAQFAIRKLADVPAGAFLPPPKVDSVVVEFVPVETGLTANEEAGFFALVRSAFKQPRKTLSNNLFAAGSSREEVESAMREAGVPEKARPSDLNLEDWKRLFRAIRP